MKGGGAELKDCKEKEEAMVDDKWYGKKEETNGGREDGGDKR